MEATPTAGNIIGDPEGVFDGGHALKDGPDVVGDHAAPPNHRGEGESDPAHVETVQRAELSAKERDALADSDFAFIDDQGARHLPIHDEAHARAALGGNGFSAQQGIPDDKKAAVAKKIAAAATKFDIDVDPDSAVGKAAGLKKENTVERTEPVLSVEQADAIKRAAKDRDGEAFKQTVTEVFEGVKGQLARAAGVHDPFDGSHTHGHPANGAQGGDDTHSHEHSHGGDADHGHSHTDLSRAEGTSPEDEMTDAQMAQQAIDVVMKLIAREAAEFAAGDEEDRYDVASLMWILDSLKEFQAGEFAEAAAGGAMQRSHTDSFSQQQPNAALEAILAQRDGQIAEMRERLTSFETTVQSAVERAAAANTAAAEALERIQKAETGAEELKRAADAQVADLSEKVAPLLVADDDGHSLIQRMDALESQDLHQPRPLRAASPVPLDKLFPGDTSSDPNEVKRVFDRIKRENPDRASQIDALSAEIEMREIHRQGGTVSFPA